MVNKYQTSFGKFQPYLSKHVKYLPKTVFFVCIYEELPSFRRLTVCSHESILFSRNYFRSITFVKAISCYNQISRREILYLKLIDRYKKFIIFSNKSQKSKKCGTKSHFWDIFLLLRTICLINSRIDFG